MNGTGGMRWLGWLIAGPAVWALAFTAAYGLHGVGCALGWPGQFYGPVSVQRAVIGLVGLAGILACLCLLARVKSGLGDGAGIPRLGILIGLFATIFTLAPVLVASTC